MSTFALLLILILPGKEPKIQQVPMPDLDHCFTTAQGFLTSPKIREHIRNGGVIEAACAEIVSPGNPA